MNDIIEQKIKERVEQICDLINDLPESAKRSIVDHIIFGIAQKKAEKI